MRLLSFARLLVVCAVAVVSASAQTPTCTGLCLQQLPPMSCPNNGTTSISGTVYTPNGTDPLPGVLVYIPNAPVPMFTPGVSCPVAGAPPPGNPLVGTTTAVDGTFTIDNVPVGTSIPLVIQKGRWRRQFTVSTTACQNTAFDTRMPKNQIEGDIPKFAIVTGNADQVECVLRKVGVDDAEFTNPSGTGRISLYQGEDFAGAQIDPTTPFENALMGTQAAANSFDVIMLPCQGTASQLGKTSAELQNFAGFANAGGRVYSSHYSYDYMVERLNGTQVVNPNLPAVANWQVNQAMLPDGPATVNVSFPQGATLAEWLQLVHASSTQGQVPLQTLRHDLNGVIAPTQTWLTLDNPSAVMQFVFNTPVGAATQCGRVLFNEYHVENGTSSGAKFPCECQVCDASGAPTGALPPMTAQEKLLEYMLFELTDDGAQPTISPTSADFGKEAVGFTTAPQSFTWTNNSTFPATARATTGAGSDFLVTSANCNQVAPSSSCTISVAFKPTAVGARTGTLTVNSSGPSLTAALTGIGIPDLSVAPGALQFGNTDVGASVSQTLTITNPNPAALPFPGAIVMGDYSTTTNCGNNIAANSSCTLTVIFKPSTTGDRPGTVTVGNSPTVTLDGNGIDFTLATTPSSGTVIAGLSVGSTSLTSPLAGFANPVTLTCTSSAPAVTCVPPSSTFTPSSPTSVAVQIDTVSKYTVIGFGSLGAGWLSLAGAATGLLLFWQRRRLNHVARACLLILLTGVMTASSTGCSGKQPAQNALYTPPGSYTVTLSATDGFLVHTATYSLVVTAK
jgi:hypothetical protein